MIYAEYEIIDVKKEKLEKKLYDIFLKCIFYGISFEKIKNIYEKSKEDSNGCGSNEPL